MNDNYSHLAEFEPFSGRWFVSSFSNIIEVKSVMFPNRLASLKEINQ